MSVVFCGVLALARYRNATRVLLPRELLLWIAPALRDLINNLRDNIACLPQCIREVMTPLTTEEVVYLPAEIQESVLDVANLPSRQDCTNWSAEELQAYLQRTQGLRDVLQVSLSTV